MAVTARRMVREIPRAAILHIDTAEITKLVVVAYARVSTEKEEQEDSFERQVSHYTTLITSKPEWSFGGIYADPGITGTRAEKRPDFMRMIADCRAGKINKILVKSISRFARNTVDALNYIRELRELGISVYFENENIDTLTPGGEVLITILAAMAEQESRTMSTNIKWTYQKKFKNGEIVLNTGLMLGYIKTGKKDDAGRDIFEINEAEADIVRRIYREYLAGITITRICRGLEEDGISTKLGKKRWQHSVIRSILTNEKYTGDAILGKTYKPDVLTKYRKKNTGQAPMYYAEGTHPAIIDKEMFEMVKVEMQRRKDEKTTAVGSSRYTSKYPFSGLLICGNCGHRLRRHVRRVGSGQQVPAWGCANRISNGRAVCDSHHVNEDRLQQTYTAAIRDMIEDAEEIMAAVKDSAGLVMEPENKAALDRVEQEIIDLQNAVLELHKAKQQRSITAADYAAQIKECGQCMQELEARQAELQTTENRYNEVRLWLDTFAEHIRSGEIMNADDGMIMKQLVEQIIVGDSGIEVHFKCGVIAEHEYL
jgi:DNA invertase Pin-like site-specific DNA recombinase